MKTFSKTLDTAFNEGCCGSDFRLKSLTYVQAADTTAWEFPLHSHTKGLEISLILKGRGLMYYDGKMYEMQENDLVIKNEGAVHSEWSDQTDPLEQICMLFEGVRCRGGEENHVLKDYMQPVLKVPAIHVLRSMAFHIRHLCIEGHSGEALRQLCRAFVETACSQLPEDREKEIPEADYCIIRNIREYIDRHYHEKLSLKMLGNLFYIDSYYLAHRFKEVTGYSFRQYVIQRRIGEAERLLVFENIGIEEIAKRVGYETVQYFYYSFKKTVGCTPVEFREKYI